jgi:hypothetical protein
VRWLHALGHANLAAARAWMLCTQMLHEAATRMGRTCEDLPQEPPRSAGLHGDDLEKQHNVDFGGQAAGQAQGPAFVPTSSTAEANMSILDTSIFNMFSGLDHFMQYDQYFPVLGVDPNQIEYQQAPNQTRSNNMQRAPVSDMDFLYQYTDDLGFERSHYGRQ